MKSEIENFADFSIIRYAQCWEDTRILLKALDLKEGETYVSIASGGDNSLAMLTQKVHKVIALDLNPAQLHCVHLKKAAFQKLDYNDLLTFLGITPCENRWAIFDELKELLPHETKIYWEAHPELLEQGIIHSGKFENYFRLFRKKVLPFIYNKKTIADLVRPKTKEERIHFYNNKWNKKRWNLLFRLFFSRKMMGKLGRDAAFFKYVEGHVAENILKRVKYALTELDCSKNPYLEYILFGTYKSNLPYYLRPEHFDIIKSNIDRLEIQQNTIEGFLSSYKGAPISGYNLSDIFEYMNKEEMFKLYKSLIKYAKEDSRVVYWNMLVPRQCPKTLKNEVKALEEISRALFLEDEAFFYSKFIVEEIKKRRNLWDKNLFNL